mgnify:CR=1 FL=1|jgi:hypothetical protein|tara:strand:+ start:1380 stop:1556 length:177 start_codon:yes stop_codon:yes gene_type:complete
MYSDPVQVLLTYRRLQTKRMIESLLEKLKKFYIKLLQAQKHRALSKIAREKHLGGYVW